MNPQPDAFAKIQPPDSDSLYTLKRSLCRAILAAVNGFANVDEYFGQLSAIDPSALRLEFLHEACANLQSLRTTPAIWWRQILVDSVLANLDSMIAPPHGNCRLVAEYVNYRSGSDISLSGADESVSDTLHYSLFTTDQQGNKRKVSTERCVRATAGGLRLSVEDDRKSIRQRIETLTWNAAYIRTLSALRELPSIIGKLVSTNAELWGRSGKKVGIFFEGFVLDLINEYGRFAVFSSLSEDILQATDLRLMLPGLNRPHGARVQVSLSASESSLRDKQRRIGLHNEITIITPYTLALFFKSWRGQSVINEAEAYQLAELSLCPGNSLECLADRFQVILNKACRKKASTPFRSSVIPSGIHKLITELAFTEAFVTTRRLRSRERLFGTTQYNIRRTFSVICKESRPPLYIRGEKVIGIVSLITPDEIRFELGGATGLMKRDPKLNATLPPVQSLRIGASVDLLVEQDQLESWSEPIPVRTSLPPRSLEAQFLSFYSPGAILRGRLFKIRGAKVTVLLSSGVEAYLYPKDAARIAHSVRTKTISDKELYDEIELTLLSILQKSESRTEIIVGFSRSKLPYHPIVRS